MISPLLACRRCTSAAHTGQAHAFVLSKFSDQDQTAALHSRQTVAACANRVSSSSLGISAHHPRLLAVRFPKRIHNGGSRRGVSRGNARALQRFLRADEGAIQLAGQLSRVQVLGFALRLLKLGCQLPPLHARQRSVVRPRTSCLPLFRPAAPPLLNL